jgi:hypothetical protein
MEPRNRNVIIIIVAVAVLICLCLATAAGLLLSGLFITDARSTGPGAFTGAEESRTFVLEPGAALTVDNFAGNVTVQAGDEGRIQVVAVRRAASSGTRDRIQIQYQETARGLEVRSVKPAGLLINAHVEFHIEVPPGTPVEVETGSGSVQILGTQAGVRAETGSGTVTAASLEGEVDLRTGSGNIDVQDAVGTVTVQTGSGALSLRDIEGDIDAHTGSGGITAEDASGQVRLDTGSGSVEYRGTPAGECRFQTGSGRVALYLPADIDARVDLQTSSGTVDVQFPVDGQSTRQRVEGVIGSGEEASIWARTSSGSIDVYQY